MTNRILQFAGAAAVAAGLLTAQPAFAQDKKVALVIGNAIYQNVVPLKNPANDAADMGDALRRAGFNVTTLANARVADMRRRLKQFGDRARLAEVAVVFYSGHALQSDGVTWLLATDGQARSLADIARGAISLPEILEQLDGVEKAGMVFIDGARNDPFGEAQKQQLPAGVKRQVEEPKNILVSFATGAGRLVGDGEGRNSPFTAALLKHIGEPGLELTALMRRVRADVIGATAGEQVPSFYLSAEDGAYFVAALPEPKPEFKPEPKPESKPESEPGAERPVAAPQAATPEPVAPAPQAAVPASQPVPEATPAAPVEKKAAAPALAPEPVPPADAGKPAAEAASVSAEPSREGADSTEADNSKD
ncbi:caspase family protein [Pseudorhodoplanes sp.]|uniref:caspase family protein n=1 Tax=Pseudorhodoplanes sp. TaxID=1934341 RepID=UPI00391B9FCD